MNKTWWSAHKIDVYYSLCIMIAGTLLHFAYAWSGNHVFVGLFSAVSESVWEHLKLFFVPAFFFSVFMYYIVGEQCPEYLWCQTKSILAGLLWIIMVYYTVAGITEREIVWVDIAIFYLSAVFAGIVGGRCRGKWEQKVKNGVSGSRKDKIGSGASAGKYAGVVLLLLWACFVGLTYRQPQVLQEWFPGLFLVKP